MKTLFRTISVLLLAGTALISACQNPLDAEKVSIINSDAKAQAEALSAAAGLLDGNSEYLSSLNSIILSLDGLDNDNLANIVDNLASMKGADPLFIKEMLSLAARYKLAPDEATKVSVGNSILAAAAGELARAKARKEACEDAAAAKSEMENTVNTLKGKLSARIDAFDLLCRLEGIIPALESSHAVAQALKSAPRRPDTDVIVVNLSGRGDKDMENIREWKRQHR